MSRHVLKGVFSSLNFSSSFLLFLITLKNTEYKIEQQKVKVFISKKIYFSSLLQVNSANQTKFLTQLGIGLTVFGATCYQLKQIVFVREQCNSTPYHLMKNE